MLSIFNPETVEVAFAQPNNDGSFPPEQEAYLNEVGNTRLSIVLPFAPKAAATYLRTAARS